MLRDPQVEPSKRWSRLPPVKKCRPFLPVPGAGQQGTGTRPGRAPAAQVRGGNTPASPVRVWANGRASGVRHPGRPGTFSSAAGPRPASFPEDEIPPRGLWGCLPRQMGRPDQAFLAPSAPRGAHSARPWAGAPQHAGSQRRPAAAPLGAPLPITCGRGEDRRPGAAPPPPPRQAEAARWRRRRQPRGRGRSARLAASLLPREAGATLSRAAAPRPVNSPRLGHGGTRRQRARGAGECETAGGKRPRRSEQPEGRSEGTAVGGGWPKAGAV